MKYRRFEDLPVWQEAAELARRMYEFTSLEPFRRHPGLRDQLERAALSVSNNIAEGFERGTTNELWAFSTSPAAHPGKSSPCFACWRAGEPSAISNLRFQILEREQLYGWIENLKNSEISGQRHLDEKRKATYTGRKDREAFLEELRRTTESAAEQRKKPKAVDDAS